MCLKGYKWCALPTLVSHNFVKGCTFGLLFGLYHILYSACRFDYYVQIIITAHAHVSQLLQINYINFHPIIIIITLAAISAKKKFIAMPKTTRKKKKYKKEKSLNPQLLNHHLQWRRTSFPLLWLCFSCPRKSEIYRLQRRLDSLVIQVLI